MFIYIVKLLTRPYDGHFYYKKKKNILLSSYNFFMIALSAFFKLLINPVVISCVIFNLIKFNSLFNFLYNFLFFSPLFTIFFIYVCAYFFSFKYSAARLHFFLNVSAFIKTRLYFKFFKRFVFFLNSKVYFTCKRLNFFFNKFKLSPILQFFKISFLSNESRLKFRTRFKNKQ